MSIQPEERVNIYDAKTELSRLVSRVEEGERIVISRNGRMLVAQAITEQLPILTVDHQVARYDVVVI